MNRCAFFTFALLAVSCSQPPADGPDTVLPPTGSPTPATAAPQNGGAPQPQLISTPGRPTPSPSPQVRVLTSDRLTTDELNQHRGERGVARLSWRTHSEQNNFGFTIMRGKSPDGPFVQANERIIMGAGNSSTPLDYEFYDTNVKVGETYYYQVHSINMSGMIEPKTALSPFTVNRLYLGGDDDKKTTQTAQTTATITLPN